MDQEARYRVRLRVAPRIGLTTSETTLTFSHRGRPVSLKSQTPQQPLSEAKWWIFGARGFRSETEAREFGEEMRSAVQIAALCTHVGVDAGQDQPTSWMSEAFARATGAIEPHQSLVANVHGLTVLPDDDNIRFPIVEATGTTSMSHEQFGLAFSQALEALPSDGYLVPEGVRLLNLALMCSQPLAKLIVALSSVEALAHGEEWSEDQKLIVRELAEGARGAVAGTEKEREEIASALVGSLRRFSVRQGVRRVLERHGLGQLLKEWDAVYNLRSAIVHGATRLPEHEITEVANRALRLCGRIIMAGLERDGVKPPAVFFTNFS